jgi:hypothetical protein
VHVSISFANNNNVHFIGESGSIPLQPEVEIHKMEKKAVRIKHLISSSNNLYFTIESLLHWLSK